MCTYEGVEIAGVLLLCHINSKHPSAARQVNLFLPFPFLSFLSNALYMLY
jgi:hypothetical protein